MDHEREEARAWQTWIALVSSDQPESAVPITLEPEAADEVTALSMRWGMPEEDVIRVFLYRGAVAEGAYP